MSLLGDNALDLWRGLNHNRFNVFNAFNAFNAQKFSSLSPALTAILFVVTGYLLFNFVDAGNKYMLGKFMVYEAMFYTSLCACLVFALIAICKGGWNNFRTRTPHLHIIRTAFCCTAALCVCLCLKTLPLANFYALIFMGPIITVILASLFLGDRVSPKRLGAIILGFMGVLIVANPSINSLSLGILFGLGAVLSISTSNILIRKMDKNDSMILFSLPTSLVIMLGCLPFVLQNGVLPSLPDLLLFAAIGTTLAMAIMAVTHGFKTAPQVSSVAPFSYIQILGGTILGYLFWNEMPTANIIIGASVIIASGLYIIYQERGKASPLAKHNTHRTATSSALLPMRLHPEN